MTMQPAGLALIPAAIWLISGLAGSDRAQPLIEPPQRLGQAALGVVIQIDKLSAAICANPVLMLEAAAISFHIGQDEGRDRRTASVSVVGYFRIADPARACRGTPCVWPARAFPTAARGAASQCRDRACARSAKAETRSAGAKATGTEG